jgi:outer membrane protein OmpA-like peptidoglycan-associated protein
MKFVRTLLLVLTLGYLPAFAQNKLPEAEKQANGQEARQPAAKSYTKNADAYLLTLAKFNSRRNDFCAINFMDAIVFTSGRRHPFWASKGAEGHNASYERLYTTEKNEKGKYLRPKLFMRDLTTRNSDGPVCFDKEGTRVYFSRNNFRKAKPAKDGSYKMRLLEARLNSNGFDTVIQFPYNSPEYNIIHPSLSQDGQSLYFASDMPGGKGAMDLYLSKKINGAWTPPVNLGEKVNTEKDELFPFIAANGLLYFSSNGHADSLGGLDIYETKIKDGVAQRSFNMGEPVNSPYDDFGYYIAANNIKGFISSNRKDNGGDDDVYELLMMREVKRGKDVTLAVKDKSSKAPLAGVRLIINSDTVTTNEQGEYMMMMEEDAGYNVQISKPDYFNLEEAVSTRSSAEDAFTKELLLEKDPKLSLYAIVKDAKTNVLLEGVSIRIQNQAGGPDFDKAVTGSEGDYRKKLTSNKVGDALSYTITVEKPGYLAKTAIFNYTITAPGEINMGNHVNLTLGKVEVGMDLAKMIEIKPIYFDLGKTLIRKDAAIELDKVVAIMNEYPNMYIELGSHTDCRAPAAANLKLSTARAKASADYIVKKGIDKSRITGKGYGETRLLNSCACEGKKVVSTCSEEEHTQNRRTEFLITKLQ